MRITAELSLYPLDTDYLQLVVAFIRDLDGTEGVEIRVNQMSTQLRGELGDVTAVVNRALANSFADGGAQALVVKYLNADLPISEEPDLDSVG
jgi:uncharacterized protein YqgV (UPF0045/DUF77 family)